MSAYFEFNFEELDNDELRINGKSSYANKWNTIVIKKEWISWIITTLRNLTYEDYNTWQRRIINDYEDCRLIIRLRENDYSFIKIFPVWKDEVDIQIIYNSDKSTKRPLGFFVEYKIDGIEQSPIYHYN